MTTKIPKPVRRGGRLKKEPPAWMSETQKAIWLDAVKAAPKGLLCSEDYGLMMAFVIARDGMIAAAKKVNDFGMVVKGPNTGFAVQSPYEAIKNKQMSLMMDAADALGFSPSARRRLKLDVIPPSTSPIPEQVGKKEQAQIDAKTAHAGTEWADILPTAPVQ